MTRPDPPTLPKILTLPYSTLLVRVPPGVFYYHKLTDFRHKWLQNLSASEGLPPDPILGLFPGTPLGDGPPGPCLCTPTPFPDPTHFKTPYPRHWRGGLTSLGDVASSQLSIEDVDSDEVRLAVDIISSEKSLMPSPGGVVAASSYDELARGSEVVTHSWLQSLTVVTLGGRWRRLCGTPGLAPRVRRLMQFGAVRNLHQITPHSIKQNCFIAHH